MYMEEYFFKLTQYCVKYIKMGFSRADNKSLHCALVFTAIQTS